VRYAIVSDIHANLQAWNAVLTDIAAQRVGRILCLGDSVGYGPNPSEVLESVYRHVDAFCMGNHDAAVCGKLDPGLFNERARRLLDWTRTRLSDKAARFLASQPLTLAGPGFRCAHGDFTEPAAFNYIEEAEDAARSWSAASEPLLFTGHTHLPALFVIGASGATHPLPPQDFVIEPGKRYLVNPGSAGNPRADEALASYCLWDDEAGSVVWRTVPFDLDAYRAALLAAGLAENDTPFLERDPRRHLSAVREAVSFSPARTPDQLARGVTPVGELARLTRAARRWKRLALATAATGLLAAAAGLAIVRPRPVADNDVGPLILPPGELAAVAPASPGNLLPPFPVATDGASLSGWRVRLDNPRATTLAVRREGIAVIVTNGPARFRIESPPVRLNRARPETLQLKARLLKAPDFAGHAVFVVEQLGESDVGDHPLIVREIQDPPKIKRDRDGWTSMDRQATKSLRPPARFIRLAIEGETDGAITFADPVLEPQSR
jgi:predicted phosphodiesterase